MRRGLVAVCAALALAISACGEAEEDLESLAPAAKAIEAAGAVEFRSTSSSSAMAPEATISGVVDVAKGAARIKMEAGGDEFAMRIEQLIVGRDIYIRTDVDSPTASMLGAGKWQHERFPDQAGSGSFVTGYSPVQVADELRRAKEVRRAGREEIRGESTTRYTGVLDDFRHVIGVNGDLPDAKPPKVEPAQIEVWLDDRGLPRRQVTTFRFDGVESRTQTDFLRYGVKADFQPPPKSELG